MKAIDAEYIIKKHNDGTPFSPQIIEEAQKTLMATKHVNYSCIECENNFYTFVNSPEHEKQLCYRCFINNCCK